MINTYLRIAVFFALTSAFLGCHEGKRPFRIVQLCLGDRQNLVQFTNILRSVAQLEGMAFIDGSDSTEQDLKAMGHKIDPATPTINLGVERKDGMGLTAGNLGLPHYQVALGFSEGSSTSDAKRFADMVVGKLEEHWHVEFVPDPAKAGAAPLKNCDQR